LLKNLVDTEGIRLEPSALAGMIGPVKLSEDGAAYLENQQLAATMRNGTHIVWATGGSMVPKEMMEEYYQKGKSLTK
ncbi:MAG TPA: D-serine ammonia-lyase, partial [Bacillales bacterium]|nr:D-serine ammonia-lyase [Bacillales bacterium]